MTTTPLLPPVTAARDTLLRRWVGLPGWAQALLVFAASRLFGFVLIERTARFQEPSLWTGADPGYLGVVDLWDGDWYRRIAENGYPATPPLASDGRVGQSELAFYPAFPLLVRGLMSVTGLGWALTATVTAMLLAAVAVVVVRSVVERVAGPTAALWTVVLLCTFPAAPVLQLAYTESLALLVLALTFWCLQRHRYLLAVPVVLLLGYSRPIAVPVGVVVLVHLLRRLLEADTPRARLARREWLPALAVLAACGVAALEWPLTVWAITGQSDAYTQTQAAWRVGHELRPVTPWITISGYVFGHWTGLAIVLGVGVAFAVWLSRRGAGVIAGDLRVWCVTYTAYLVVVLDPYTSLVRYLLLLFPLGTLLASHSPSRAYRLSLTAAFLAGQVVWVMWLWKFVPPSDLPP